MQKLFGKAEKQGVQNFSRCIVHIVSKLAKLRSCYKLLVDLSSVTRRCILSALLPRNLQPIL